MSCQFKLLVGVWEKDEGQEKEIVAARFTQVKDDCGPCDHDTSCRERAVTGQAAAGAFVF